MVRIISGTIVAALTCREKSATAGLGAPGYLTVTCGGGPVRRVGERIRGPCLGPCLGPCGFPGRTVLQTSAQVGSAGVPAEAVRP